ncbi:UvrD-helicase domain-containing protein [Desulfobacula phenolica]|uniref:DNA 3'-5' helicase n=1 Tax=Desulfobacula phenolica TaxID=90732 RepID=A0A1H2DXN1_9BACT|nr:UvrD-helicase domain-containing protein [Desulfobacula phenolica]SDT87592.1 TIGR00375 family protein [Desulfobacula phenolica]
MKFIADLHVHSKYSRATAKNLDFENLYYTAQMKGITVVGTGDFTYPAWIDEIESKLEETEPGMFSLKKEIARDIDKTVSENCRNPVRFILQTEISNIYKKDDRVRKNHNLVYFPDIASVKKFNARLDAIGNIKSDGRPILGLDAADLLAIMLDVNDKGFFVPAHIWTPWFSMFGSKSGFDSIEECFGSLKEHIFAVETGLSSDPPMNWRIKDLDNVRLLSNSDAHSPGYLGRNASVFDTELSFFHMRQALEKNDLEHYQGTLDMFPHQGKYHYDGHRKCNICLNPAATDQIDGICPECGKKVTYGVLNRVQELSQRPEGYVPENRHGYQSIIPLADMLSEIFEVGPKTKKVATYYQKAIENLGPELGILLDKSFEEIKTANIPLLAEAVQKMRTGDVNIDPGYDGEYGKVNLFSRQEKKRLKGDNNLLFKLPAKKAKKNAKAVVKKPGAEKNNEKNQNNKEKPRQTRPANHNRDLLAGLNPEQQKAVESSARAVVIQAGPGTGKTRTLTAKIAWLISKKNIDPLSILALTFTNKAATQLGQRMDNYMTKAKTPVLAATFHSFCLKLLKEYKAFDAVIVDDPIRLSLVKEAIESLESIEITKENSKKGQVNKTDQLISLCKQNLLGPEDDLEKFIPLEKFVHQGELESFKKIYQAYQVLCKEHNVADFEDLMAMTINMLNCEENVLASVRKQYQYIFIDEYQDLNFGQYVFVKLISQDNHIFVIGDPDQSIYGFRGSDNKYFKLFEDDFPGCEKILLTQNYRSTQTILDASFQMISNSLDNEEKFKVFSDVESQKKLIIKETATERAEAVAIGKMIENLVGGTSFFSMDAGKTDQDETKDYCFADFAVLYRTRKQCEIFIDVFEKEGIPFQAADKKNMVDIEGIRQLISLCRIMSQNECFIDVEIVFDHFGVRLGKKGKEIFHKAYNDACKTNQDILDEFVQTDISGIKAATRQNIVMIAQKLKCLQEEIMQCDTETGLRLLFEKADLKPIIESNDKTNQIFEKLLSIGILNDDLRGFLDAVALNQDEDTLEFNTQKVSLMTLHAAKGLEFPVVFVAGCEQGLVPFARDGKNTDDLEEERRLFYVGMTRAMDILCLTYAKKRRIFGTIKKRQRSFFIEDIEAKLTQVEKAPVKLSVKKKAKQLELF